MTKFSRDLSRFHHRDAIGIPKGIAAHIKKSGMENASILSVMYIVAHGTDGYENYTPVWHHACLCPRCRGVVIKILESEAKIKESTEDYAEVDLGERK